MQATISRSTDLVNGGCNACPTVKTTSYNLILRNINTPLEDLDVPSLVMAVVLKAGYRQELRIDFMEEYVEFKKEDKAIQLLEEYGVFVYRSGSKEMKSAAKYPGNEALFNQVNRILTDIFELEEVTFEIEK
ncbi:DUF4809 family protein [Enterococcus olivae]